MNARRDLVAASHLTTACRKRGFSYRVVETPEENWRVEVFPVPNQGRKGKPTVPPASTFTAEHKHQAMAQAVASFEPLPERAPVGNQHAKGWPAKRAARLAAELARVAP